MGNEVPPGPGDGAGDACGDGDGDGWGVWDTNCAANEITRQKQAATRTIEFIFTSQDALRKFTDEIRAPFSYKRARESNVSVPGEIWSAPAERSGDGALDRALVFQFVFVNNGVRNRVAHQ